METLRDERNHDMLTGVLNRRGFWEEAEMLTSDRKTQPVSIVVADLDYFKRVNDNWGHEYGDNVLKAVAAVMQASIRGTDLAARFGGEEFVLLLPGADGAQARETAQNCLDHIRREAIAHAASSTSSLVTISIGVATVVPHPSLDATLLVNTADAAMYRAKSAGRARYELATQEDWEIEDDTPRTRPAPLS